jgi:hypothetical protein
VFQCHDSHSVPYGVLYGVAERCRGRRLTAAGMHIRLPLHQRQSKVIVRGSEVKSRPAEENKRSSDRLAGALGPIVGRTPSLLVAPWRVPTWTAHIYRTVQIFSHVEAAHEKRTQRHRQLSLSR